MDIFGNHTIGRRRPGLNRVNRVVTLNGFSYNKMYKCP